MQPCAEPKAPITQARSRCFWKTWNMAECDISPSLGANSSSPDMARRRLRRLDFVTFVLIEVEPSDKSWASAGRGALSALQSIATDFSEGNERSTSAGLAGSPEGAPRNQPPLEALGKPVEVAACGDTSSSIQASVKLSSTMITDFILPSGSAGKDLACRSRGCVDIWYLGPRRGYECTQEALIIADNSYLH